MGLLDKLWDDTVAGPRPDSGLGKLRKFSTFVAPRIDTSGKGCGAFCVAEVASELGNGTVGGGGEDSPEETTPRVTRSIMIKRPSGSPAATPPESPAGSTPPLSPFFGAGGRREWNRFRRKSTSDAFDRGAAAGGSGSTAPTTPTGGVPPSRNSYPPFEV